MKVQINEPCPANWDKMQIKLHARHCEQCDKSVIDFTQKSRAEIIAFLLENPNGSVCGRMNRQQFDIKEEDLPELISIISQPRFRANAFLILAIVCTSIFQSCENSPTDKNQVVKPKIELKNNNPLGKEVVVDTVQISKINNNIKHKTSCSPDVMLGEVSVDKSQETEVAVAGGITYEPIPPNEEGEVLSYAEIMPEYPGGMSEMLKFIDQNLIIPTQFADENFSGRVYVQFVVMKTGEIEKITIANGIDGLNQEAIRLVKQMPKWKPGINNGKEVNVKMVIPIIISLN